MTPGSFLAHSATPSQSRLAVSASLGIWCHELVTTRYWRTNDAELLVTERVPFLYRGLHDSRSVTLRIPPI